MTEKLGEAIERLAGVSGWDPERAANHIAGLANGLVEKAEERSTAAARKVFEKIGKPRTPGRRRGRAAGATAA
jgi:hypothetical protein